MMKYKVKRMLLAIILASFVFLFFQEMTKLIKERDLAGYVTYTLKPGFTFEKWFNGTWQETEEKYCNETFGLRTSFVRLHNQIYFNLYKKAVANGVIIGKQNYLYEKNYIDAWYGNDFVGDDSILRQAKKLKYLQDTLSKLGKQIAFVFLPGKASVYNEFIPDELRTKRKTTNHDTYIKYENALGLLHQDLWSTFMDLKPMAKYPLYTKYGIHWSAYGTMIGLDSFVHFVGRLRNIEPTEISWGKFSASVNVQGATDDDIGRGMNLFRLPAAGNYFYPEVKINDGKIKPKALIVADSYFWTFFGTGFTYHIFDRTHFYYYNMELNCPEIGPTPIPKKDVKLLEEIKSNDLVLIMSTDANLNRPGWGFIEEAYRVFGGK
jgi:hypothetical protein